MFLPSIATAAVLASGFHAPVVPPLPPQAQTTPATAEGVEILRRILTDSVAQAFKGDDPDQRDVRFHGPDRSDFSGLVTTLWSTDQVVSHSRAFHLPGHGVFFTLDVRMPTVQRETAPEDERTDAPHDDEWDRMRRQVRGGQGGGFVMRSRAKAIELEIDPSAVERLTETVLTALGRHATRIEGLESQDVLTVALHLSGGHDAAWSHFNVLTQDENDGEDQSLSYVLALGAGVPEEHLVIQLSMADVLGAGQGGTVRLGERARINRY
jgi:hypothetical protein